MRFKTWMENRVIRVFRGTGAQGMQQMRPSEEGMHGPGIYFYDNLKDAQAYAEPGGGVIEAEVDLDAPGVTITAPEPVHMVGTNFELRKRRLVVVPSADLVRVIQHHPA